MSWQTNSLVLVLRSIGRKCGLNRWIVTLLRSDGYEKRYDNGFSSALRQGDCVWDVGANVGYYTKLFSERVGEQGSVYAFEPSPINFNHLTAACASLNNIKLLQIGLGDKDDTLFFQQGDDSLGATSRVIADEQGSVVVNIRSGKNLILNDGIPVPNAIKIDVEGFECEVLDGLDDYLKKTDLRVIGIEVHFGILEERGISNGSKKIESLLSFNGFSVSWVDSSHILATREA